MVDNKHSAIHGLDQLVISEFPYPIAVNYRQLLETEGWQARTRKCIEVFEFGLRAITLGVLSQYLVRDVHQVSDPELDRKLYRNLAQASLGQWNEFFFLGLRAYRGRRELLFMPELYDLYWDTSHEPHEARRGVRGSFDRLVQIRNDLAHRLAPDREEDWEALGQEALGQLRAVLEHFDFLRHYDLIRIVVRRGEEYEYDRFTGQEITTHSERLQGQRKDEELRPGWFYLSRQDRSVLQLHPMFVFWTDGEGAEPAEGRRQDAAVFDRLLKEAVEYVATVVRQMVEKRDVELLAQFRELLYHNIEHIKMARKRTVLSWTGLRRAAAELTALQMGAVREKYRQALYLQREETFHKFKEFLASDKGCFVLTGKSGVGKSNFVLSLADEFAEREDVCLLLYNGARLSVRESMVQTISQDLARYLTLEGEVLQDLFTELEQRGEMVGKTMIVVFDAINENVEGRALLRQIDQMVEALPYSWLKVVITSRPQAWRTLKKGLPLAAERYYRERGSDEYWVELQEFTVKLEPFRSQELPDVYEKYRLAYKLLTPYEMLRVHIQNVLRDPLVLRLVAEIYRGQAIPERIRVTDIYDQYVQVLVKTGRLHQEDLILLERELMPLMLAKGHYANQVAASQIHTAKTWDGRPLWELIRSDDLLGSGQRINASYGRLVDAGILVELGSGWDYAIGFEYERFYEFFAGGRLREIRQENPDFYGEVGAVLGDRLFLWGALVHAVTFELSDGNTDLFVGLVPGAEENRLLRSALVTALTQFGEKDHGKAEDFIKGLVGEFASPPRTIFGALWRLLRPARDTSVESLTKQSIAIEAAANLGMVDLLEQAAAEPFSDVRAIAAQHIFYLWKEHPSAGFEALDALSCRVTNQFGLPDVGVVESVIGIVGAILGYEHTDKQMLKSLLILGRRSFRQVLHLSDEGNGPMLYRRVKRILLIILYKLIVGVILRFVIRVMRSWGPHAWASIDTMAHVFELSDFRKDLLRTFVPLLDPDAPNLAERVADMIIIEEWGDAIGQALVEHCILAHGVKDFDQALAIVKEMTEFALEPKPPRFWVGSPLFNLWQSAMRIQDPNPEMLKLVEKVTAAIQEDPVDWSAHARAERPVPITSDTPVAFLALQIGATYSFGGESCPRIVIDCLERAMANGDVEFLRLYIAQELTVLFECGLPYAALLALRPVADYADPQVRNALVELLVRVRQSKPELVEDLFMRGGFPQEIVAKVQATPTSERLVDIMTYQLATILYDLFILGPKALNTELQWLYAQAFKLPNFQGWLSLSIKELGNLILGEIVFSVPEDAPSRRLIQTGVIADLVGMDE